ncbi:type II toxin-antitoxin system VapB family antitoxin [Streptomyces sp. NPDC127084]|uniref:type II toxin-antitoxin system VapB family antitoxin n=1 Tax=Streptomyces sp. NPDC127084 TaxID=3347133 RepID=UPI00364A0961
MKRYTVNTALREVMARYRRLRALEESRKLAAQGALDIDILLDKHMYRGSASRNNGGSEPHGGA